MIYRDRTDAGEQLAMRLRDYADRSDVLVLALQRGGVPVAYEVARELGAPLDVLVVRRLGVPGHEELAMGAIASGGVRVLNEDLVSCLRISDRFIDSITATEQKELERREDLYRGHRAQPDVKGKTIILIDDGLASGSTFRAAAAALRHQGPARIVVAVPVSAIQTCDEYRMSVDEIICAKTPEPFTGVVMCYGDFSQTTDAEVSDLLTLADANLRAGSLHQKAHLD